MFGFVNSYISNYIIAYKLRDFGQLTTNLVIIMVFKQIGANIAEWLMDIILIGRKIRNVKKHFNSKIAEATAAGKNIDPIAAQEREMHQHIEVQLAMS